MAEMVEKVVSVDFGKDARESARRFARLVGLVEEQYEAFLKNPTRFFAEAGNAIGEREAIIREARDALRPRLIIYDERIAYELTPYEPLRTVSVTKEEYDRLQACANIIKAARPL